MPARRYEGKVALVTGAARGQGRAVAVRLAQEGADLVLVDSCAKPASTAYAAPEPHELDETAQLVRDEGRQVLARQVDVRDLAGLEATVQDGDRQLGRLDVVVANAGICSAARVWEISPEQWQETLDVNLTGVFHTARATVPVLLEQGTGGAIVITSSVAGLRGLPFLGHYAASKHGVVGLARTMANELAQHRIRVNTVHPHGVATGMTVPDMQGLVAEQAATLGPIFMGALPDPVSTPEDIAAAIAWLASDEARHVTGVALPVDLGTLAR